MKFPVSESSFAASPGSPFLLPLCCAEFSSSCNVKILLKVCACLWAPQWQLCPKAPHEEIAFAEDEQRIDTEDLEVLDESDEGKMAETDFLQ